MSQWLLEFLIKPSNSYALDRLKRSYPFPKAMLQEGEKPVSKNVINKKYNPFTIDSDCLKINIPMIEFNHWDIYFKHLDVYYEFLAEEGINI